MSLKRNMKFNSLFILKKKPSGYYRWPLLCFLLTYVKKYGVLLRPLHIAHIFKLIAANAQMVTELGIYILDGVVLKVAPCGN